jgi:hypothetical protein
MNDDSKNKKDKKPFVSGDNKDDMDFWSQLKARKK